MAEIRLIVTDLDGTFLSTHNDAHPENIRAMRLVQEHGIGVCGATGRAFSMCRHVIARYGFHPYVITSGGAAIIDAQAQEPLYLRTIKPTALLPLLYASWRTEVDAMDSFNYRFTAGFGKYTQERRMRVDVRNAVIDQKEREDYRVYTNFIKMFYDIEYLTELVYLHTKDGCGVIPQKLQEILYQLDAFDISVSAQGCIDVVPRGCNKGVALQRLCHLLGVERENVMAIGDQLSDIPMLQWAGVGVAVGNAPEEVKQEADLVTVDYRDAGFAKAVYEVAMGLSFD